MEHLKTYSHQIRKASVGSILFHKDSRVRHVYVVDTGAVELCRYTENGSQLVLQRATGNSVLAEASIYSERYHCDAIIAQPALLLQFSKQKMLEFMTTDTELVRLWGAYLTSAIQDARHRAEILSRRTVAGRLDGWLAIHDQQLPDKGKWKQIATEIGVTPEALYREFAKRR